MGIICRLCRLAHIIRGGDAPPYTPPLATALCKMLNITYQVFLESPLYYIYDSSGRNEVLYFIIFLLFLLVLVTIPLSSGSALLLTFLLPMKGVLARWDTRTCSGEASGHASHAQHD